MKDDDKFQVAYGEIIASTIILVRGKGKWQPFHPNGWENTTSIQGLRAWMQERKLFGWTPETLRQEMKNKHVWHYGESRYWIPLVKETWAAIMRRCETVAGIWTQWGVLPFVDPKGNVLPHPPRTLSGLKQWMADHPIYGWNPEKLVQDKDDEHIFDYDRDQLWVPKIDTTVSHLQGSVTCVNPLGCETLTLGKMYVPRKQEDGLVTVVDDENNEKEFLVERFRQ